VTRHGNATAGDTAFGPPIHDRSSAASATRDRRCDEPGCSTLLSRYNDDTSCWLHARPTFVTRSAGRHGAPAG
jgi:hypothetical protein